VTAKEALFGRQGNRTEEKNPTLGFLPLADSSRSRFWLPCSGQIDIEGIDFLGAGIAQNQGRAVRRETGPLAERTGSAPDTL